MKRGAAMKREGTLTPKQAEFVRQYLIDLNASRAARDAGYSVKTANAIGCELLRNPDVVAALEKAKAERAQRVGLTADWIVERAMHIADSAERDSDRIAALNLLSKHSAASAEFNPTQKHEHTGKDGERLSITIDLGER